MVSEYEASKLKRDMFHEIEGSGLATVAKCAAGLAIVALIAVIGVTAPPEARADVASAGVGSAYPVTQAQP